MLCAEFAECFEEFRGGADQVHVSGDGFDDDAGDLVAGLGEGVDELLGVVVVEYPGVLGEVGGHAGRGGVAEGEHAAAGFDQQAVGVAVVAAFEFDEQVAPGVAARQADGAHGGFGAGGDEAHHVEAGDEFDELFGQVDFSFCGRAEGEAVGGSFLHGADDVGVGMADDQRPPGADVIEVTLAVGIPEVGACATGEEARFAADGTEGAHR